MGSKVKALLSRYDGLARRDLLFTRSDFIASTWKTTYGK
jgi:hypothetical protein